MESGVPAAQNRRSKRDVESAVIGTLPFGSNHVLANLDTPLPLGLSPESLPGAAHPAEWNGISYAVLRGFTTLLAQESPQTQ